MKKRRRGSQSRRQSTLTLLLKGVISKSSSRKPEFVTAPLSKEEVYGLWLAQIDRLEQSTISRELGDKVAPDNALNLGFQLFPIIDSVSYNLFGKNGRRYLKELGYSDFDADLMYSMFRNGQLHNTDAHRLVYDDGEIGWAISSSSGSGGLVPHNPGYTSKDYPEINEPADRAFEFEDIGGLYYASLSLDRLLMHVKYDLEQRRGRDSRDQIDFIVGQRIRKNMRKPQAR